MACGSILKTCHMKGKTKAYKLGRKWTSRDATLKMGDDKLSKKRTKSPSSHPAWEDLCRQFTGHPALANETIYALPKQLINAIKKHAPKLLSKEDLKFEHTLTELGGMGFFLKRPFSYPLLPQSHFPLAAQRQVPLTKKQQKVDDAFKHSIESIREMRMEVMRDQGCSELTIKQYLEKIEWYQLRAEERQRGYAGWLITNSLFQISRMTFLSEWDEEIKNQNQMPSFPMVMMVQQLPQVPEDQREFYSGYMTLFRKWSLETLSTWHLPLPMQANPLKFSPYHQDSLGESGINLFIPWYLLGDKNLKLREIAADEISSGRTRHLREWLDPNDQNNKKWGHTRFATMLEMYVYLIRGLYFRYPEQIKRNIRRIDEAYTEFQYGKSLSGREIEKKVDSIKKVRQELQRRLSCCDEEVEKHLSSTLDKLPET